MPRPVVPIFSCRPSRGGLARHVQRGVERQDQRAGFADAQARAHLHAGFFQALDFFSSLAADSTTPLPM
jgi:hypothetical protein